MLGACCKQFALVQSRLCVNRDCGVHDLQLCLQPGTGVQQGFGSLRAAPNSSLVQGCHAILISSISWRTSVQQLLYDAQLSL